MECLRLTLYSVLCYESCMHGAVSSCSAAITCISDVNIRELDSQVS